MSALVAENKAKIAANRAAIFNLEGSVNHNKANAYLTRSVVAENAALIAKNYNSAFLGNRQLANENTEALFRNRIALAQCLPASTDVEVNFREATINKAKLAYLDHRSTLNGQVLSITQDMAALNAQAIAINRRIMESNENIKEFNAKLIAENTAWLDGNCASTATPESNSALIEANAAKIAAIKERVEGNNRTAEELLATTEANRNAALANSAQIAERRQAILKNYEQIKANRHRIAERVAGRVC
jgi:hypothetical protein